MSLRSRGAFAFAALALAGVLTPARAANPAPTPSPTATAPPEIGHVVTSDRHDEPVGDAIRPTFVVDRAHIDAEGDRTIAQAIAEVPGVALFSYGPFGAETNYGIRGSSSQQTLVLLDGIPISAASNGVVDLGTFSTNGVSRIEIVESGGSTLYGANAVGGIINIITSVPRGEYLLGSTGSLGNDDVRVSGGNGVFGATLERHVASNSYAYPALDGYPAGVRSNDYGQQSDGRFSLDAPLSSTWSVRGSAGFDALTNGVPGSVVAPTFQAQQRNLLDDAHLEAVHASAQSTFSVTASGSIQNIIYDDPSAGGESATYDGRTGLSLRDVTTGGRGTLVAGVDLARESALDNLGPSGPPQTFTAAQSQVAEYAQYTVAAPGLRYYGGIRFENDSPMGAIAAPALGVLVPAGAFKFAANYATSYRVPTLIDLYYPGFSNPDLRPERAQNADVTASLGGVSLGWFNRYAINLITLDQNYVPQNTARASIAGFVANARTKPRNGFSATLGITNVYRAVDLSPGAANNRLPFEPAFIATLGLEHPLGTGRFGFGAYAIAYSSHNQTVYDASGNAADANVAGPSSVNGYVRWRMAPRAILSLRALNVGNDQQGGFAGYPAPGTTYVLELSTR